MDPIYTSANCRPAYELRWSLALFGNRAVPPADRWLEQLRSAVEADGVRLLEHTFRSPTTILFLLSTQPRVAPWKIVKSVKGRLQHVVRGTHGELFRRNFSLSSVGDVRREAVESYVAGQLGHHCMADARVQERLAANQLAFPEVDLSQPQFSAHGRYHCNLHLVLVHDERWREVRSDRLAITRDMVSHAAHKKQHRLSRLAILPDHLHLTLGFGHQESPQDVALGYMNNLAYVHGMATVYKFSYYVGTFGEYDMAVVRRALRAETSPGPVAAEPQNHGPGSVACESHNHRPGSVGKKKGGARNPRP